VRHESWVKQPIHLVVGRVRTPQPLVCIHAGRRVVSYGSTRRHHGFTNLSRRRDRRSIIFFTGVQRCFKRWPQQICWRHKQIERRERSGAATFRPRRRLRSRIASARMG
jgi:hypothetical protein